jgi:hypothetical protein
VIIFIDLVLHRARAYRHLLFNRTAYRESGEFIYLRETVVVVVVVCSCVMFVASTFHILRIT